MKKVLFILAIVSMSISCFAQDMPLKEQALEEFKAEHCDDCQFLI